MLWSCSVLIRSSWPGFHTCILLSCLIRTNSLVRNIAFHSIFWRAVRIGEAMCWWKSLQWLISWWETAQMLHSAAQIFGGSLTYWPFDRHKHVGLTYSSASWAVRQPDKSWAFTSLLRSDYCSCVSWISVCSACYISAQAWLFVPFIVSKHTREIASYIGRFLLWDATVCAAAFKELFYQRKKPGTYREVNRTVAGLFASL